MNDRIKSIRDEVSFGAAHIGKAIMDAYALELLTLEDHNALREHLEAIRDKLHSHCGAYHG